MQIATITIVVRSDKKQFLPESDDIAIKAHDALFRGDYTTEIVEAPIEQLTPA